MSPDEIRLGTILTGAGGPTPYRPPASGGAAESGAEALESFRDTLGGFLRQVNEKQLAADQGVEDLAAGKPVEMHDLMVRQEEASVSLGLLVEIRNRLVDTYHELMRMSV